MGRFCIYHHSVLALSSNTELTSSSTTPSTNHEDDRSIRRRVLAIAVALPQRREVTQDEAVLIRETPLGYVGQDRYTYGYQLSDGQSRDESAHIEIMGPEKAVVRVQGSYSWVNPEDGQTYLVHYIADENGFQPQGAHLPVAPAALVA